MFSKCDYIFYFNNYNLIIAKLIGTETSYVIYNIFNKLICALHIRVQISRLCDLFYTYTYSSKWKDLI